MAVITVIQSVYKNDKPEYLKCSLDSILNQTFSDFVLYLGIDGPIGEDLKAVINGYVDQRIRVIANKENKGLAGILNDLLTASEKEGSEFIARMDSDDIACRDRFEKQVAYLREHPEVDALGGAINEIDEQSNDCGHLVKYPCEPDACKRFFSKRNPVAHPTVMFRREFFDKVGQYYPTNFLRNEDTELWLNGYVNDAVIANLPDVLLNFRVTNDMFKQRRNGVAFAKSQLTLRKLVAKKLHYGMMSYIYAYAMFFLMISPSGIRKLAYKVLR